MADLRSSLTAAIDYVREAIRSPKDELDRWERAIRFVSDVAVLGAQQLRTDRAPQAAAALAYRTLFGLLPVLVLGTLLVRALGGFERLEAGLAEWASESGLDEVAVQQSTDAGPRRPRASTSGSSRSWRPRGSSTSPPSPGSAC